MQQSPSPTTSPLWIVGIGSSAGGIEALREMLPSIVGGPVAYVIAQHMSPVHPSLLMQVLSRETTLEVAEIANGLPLQPGFVYVAPPNCDVEVVDTRFVTEQAGPRISPQPSIDVLLASISREAAERSVSVILSGTGSDGVIGTQSVRGVGGRTIAQDPTTARYRDMPAAAVDAGAVEFVRRPQDIGPLIAELIAGSEPKGMGGRFAGNPTMAALARETRQVTGWDLAAYKDGTLGRQLDKRLSSLGLADLSEYLAHVLDDPEELTHLRDSMLISVTSFLRDRASYDALMHALRPVVAGKPATEPLRAWVAGCASGEEAYSIAMCLLEACRERGDSRGVKVFATDISESAMDAARRGVYGVEELSNVPPDWVSRYFTIEGGTALVSKPLRDTLVIARQDITRDPPLVRMDVVSCRNLLIYLVPEIQRRVLANLHAALHPSGLLFLGRSEAIPADLDLFTTVSAGNRIYQRRAGTTLATFTAPPPGRDAPTSRPAKVPPRAPRDQMRDDLRDALLADHGPPALLIDSDGALVQQIGNVSRYLAIPSVDSDFRLGSVILPQLRTEVTTLTNRLNRDGLATATHPIVLRREDGTVEWLTVQAKQFTTRSSAERFVLLTFTPGPEPSPRTRPAPAPATESDGPDTSETLRDHAQALEHELAGTREHLQAIVEELESANEALQALNEELQASSEELQATNEELETTNEELQATNEELTTVNETLEVRTAELTDTNEILRNIQESVHTAVIIVDPDLRVTQFSPLAVKMLGVSRDDLGTSLDRLPTHLDVHDLPDLVRQVMLTQSSQVHEASTSMARYLLQVIPYLIKGRQSGAILAFSDITDLDTARRDARRSQALIDAIVSLGGTPMVWLTSDARVREANPFVAQMLGILPDQLEGRPLASLAVPEDADLISSTVGMVLSHQVSTRTARVRLQLADGSIREVDLTAATVPGDHDFEQALFVTFHDVTAQERVQAEIEAQRRQLDTVFSGTGAAMAMISSDGTIVRANGALSSVLGYSAEDMCGRSLTDFTHPEDIQIDLGLFNAVLVGKRDAYQVDKRYLTSDGRTVWGRLMVSAAPGLDPGGPPILIATILDITTEREREFNALRQAQTDPLTGLANRMLAFDRLRQAALRAQRQGESVSVLFIDLNGFKGINDRAGHDVGDLVLTTVARRITSTARESDTIARLGGDEFLLIAPHEAAETAHDGVTLADRVLKAISRPIPVATGALGDAGAGTALPVVVTASIGIAHCPTDGTEVEELVRKADVAMYSAKSRGPDNIGLYSERMKDESRRLTTLRGELLQGLGSGLFVPYFQPIVMSSTGRTRAFEVLARWTHPERGVLPPADFLPLMADFGQLDALTAGLVASARTVFERLRALDPTVGLALNLDPRQLRDTDIPGLLRGAIGDDLTGWTIEITEAGAHGDDSVVRDALGRLKEMGARTALDDFGTGYSSVMHLKEWGFDEVKIDQVFVRDIADEDSRTLISTMVDMAHALGAETVAEGVETTAQADALRDLSVDLMQGYLFARPLSIDDADGWLAGRPERL